MTKRRDSREAEESVIGALMLKPDSYFNIGILSPDDFDYDDCAYLFQAIQKLAESNRPRDPVTLGDQLERLGLLDKAGGIANLMRIANATSGSANISAYADLVRDHSVGRRIRAGAAALVRSELIGDEAVGECHRLLADVRTASPVRSVDMREVLKGVYQDIERRLTGESDEIISTGLIDLDGMLGGGLKRQELIIVAGRPSIGKSTFGMQLARYIGRNHPTLVITIEQSAKATGERMLAAEAQIDSKMLKHPQMLRDGDWTEVTRAMAKLSASHMVMVDHSKMSVAAIHAEAEKLRRKHNGRKLGGIFVDYLSLVEKPQAERNDLAIGELTKGFKALAKTMDCPVVVISQLNRDVEKRTNKRPNMSDLRDSGSIEQDADLIIMCYRDEYYDENTKFPALFEAIVAKQRDGPTGTVGLHWVGSQYRLGDRAKGQGMPSPRDHKDNGLA